MNGKAAGSALAVVAMLALPAGGAAASSVNAVAGIQSGSLFFSNVYLVNPTSNTGLGNSGSIASAPTSQFPIEGDTQWIMWGISGSQSANTGFTITDATGTKDGWNFAVESGPVTEVEPASGWATGTSAMTLHDVMFTNVMSLPNITAEAGATPVDPGNYGPYWYFDYADDMSVAPVRIIETAAGYGAGTYECGYNPQIVVMELDTNGEFVDNVNYPNQPTPYEATVTFSLNSGP